MGIDKLSLILSLDNFILDNEENDHVLSPTPSLGYPPSFELWTICKASLGNEPMRVDHENVIESPISIKCCNELVETKSRPSGDEDVALVEIACTCKKRKGKKTLVPNGMKKGRSEVKFK